MLHSLVSSVQSTPLPDRASDADHGRSPSLQDSATHWLPQGGPSRIGGSNSDKMLHREDSSPVGSVPTGR